MMKMAVRTRKYEKKGGKIPLFKHVSHEDDDVFFIFMCKD